MPEVGACAKCLKWSRASSILQQMQGRGVRPNTIAFDSAVAASGGRSGSWPVALELFGDLRVGCEGRFFCWPAPGMWPQCRVDVLQLDDQRPGVALPSGSSLATGHERYRQQWQRGLNAFEELLESSACANVVSVNAALSCCRKVRATNRAFACLFEHLRQVSQWHTGLFLLKTVGDVCEEVADEVRLARMGGRPVESVFQDLWYRRKRLRSLEV